MQIRRLHQSSLSTIPACNALLALRAGPASLLNARLHAGRADYMGGSGTVEKTHDRFARLNRWNACVQ